MGWGCACAGAGVGGAEAGGLGRRRKATQGGDARRAVRAGESVTSSLARSGRRAAQAALACGWARAEVGASAPSPPQGDAGAWGGPAPTPCRRTAHQRPSTSTLGKMQDLCLTSGPTARNGCRETSARNIRSAGQARETSVLTRAPATIRRRANTAKVFDNSRTTTGIPIFGVTSAHRPPKHLAKIWLTLGPFRPHLSSLRSSGERFSIMWRLSAKVGLDIRPELLSIGLQTAGADSAAMWARLDWTKVGVLSATLGSI